MGRAWPQGEDIRAGVNEGTERGQPSRARAARAGRLSDPGPAFTPCRRRGFSGLPGRISRTYPPRCSFLSLGDPIPVAEPP
jgi:hypothetical protein